MLRNEVLLVTQLVLRSEVLFAIAHSMPPKQLRRGPSLQGKSWVPLRELARQHKEARLRQFEAEEEEERADEERKRDRPSPDPVRCYNRACIDALSPRLNPDFAPSPIEREFPIADSDFTPQTLFRRSPPRRSIPVPVTEPKVKLTDILQCEGLSKDEADEFSSSSEEDDDQDSNFDVGVEEVDAGSEGDAVGDPGDNDQSMQNDPAEQAPDETVGDNAEAGGGSGNGGDGDGQAPGDNGNAADGDDDEDGDEKEQNDGAIVEEEPEEEADDGDDDESQPEETPRQKRSRMREKTKTAPPKAARIPRSLNLGQCASVA